MRGCLDLTRIEKKKRFHGLTKHGDMKDQVGGIAGGEEY